MLIQTFQTTFGAVFQVLLLAAAGYVLVKRKVLNEEGLQQVSNLTVRFLLPAFAYFQLTTHFSYRKYPRWWLFPLLSFGITAAGYLIGKAVITVKKISVPANEFLALTAFQNSGNIPLMIVTTLFPGVLQHQLYVYILLLVIGFNLSIWAVGVRLLTNSGFSTIRKEEILNPPFVTTVLTLFIIFLGWHRLVPQSIVRPVGLFGNCALPLAMLVVGGNLATISFAGFDKKAVGWLVATKLLLMPLLAMGVVLLLKLDFAFGFLVLIEAAVPSAVTLSLMTRYFHVEEKFISQGLFFGHLLSVITIPVFLTLYFIWF